MSSREAQFATRMRADTVLMATLTGGVWVSEDVCIEGITRETAAAAFDTNGYLKPCCMIKQRGLIPDRQIVDTIRQVVSTSQVVEAWLYEDKTYTAIDAALNRLKVLFVGYMFADTFEIEWINTLDRRRDNGSLLGNSMAKIDFQVRSIWQP